MNKEIEYGFSEKESDEMRHNVLNLLAKWNNDDDSERSVRAKTTVV